MFVKLQINRPGNFLEKYAANVKNVSRNIHLKNIFFSYIHLLFCQLNLIMIDFSSYSAVPDLFLYKLNDL